MSRHVILQPKFAKIANINWRRMSVDAATSENTSKEYMNRSAGEKQDSSHIRYMISFAS